MITTIGIIGCTGRMGSAIAQVIDTHPNACLAGGLVRELAQAPEVKEDKENKPIFSDNPEFLFPHCDVLVDFSHASATTAYARIAAKHKKPFLSGTTGLLANDIDALKEIGKTIPVLYAANTSFSMAVTKRLVRMAAHLLQDQDYDVSILDKHHKWKKDAPSGTALALGQAVVDGNHNKHEPSYAAIRNGSIIGEHDILFGGAGEMITIQHVVTDRRVFARGAVDAALWLTAQKPGFYTMDDVLGL